MGNILEIPARKIGDDPFGSKQIPGICKLMDIEVLPLEPDSCATYHQLPPGFHKDPFDRMLIWLAIRKGYILIGEDQVLGEYESIGLSVVW